MRLRRQQCDPGIDPSGLSGLGFPAVRKSCILETQRSSQLGELAGGNPVLCAAGKEGPNVPESFGIIFEAVFNDNSSVPV